MQLHFSLTFFLEVRRLSLWSEESAYKREQDDAKCKWNPEIQGRREKSRRLRGSFTYIKYRIDRASRAPALIITARGGSTEDDDDYRFKIEPKFAVRNPIASNGSPCGEASRGLKCKDNFSRELIKIAVRLTAVKLPCLERASDAAALWGFLWLQ